MLVKHLSALQILNQENNMVALEIGAFSYA